MGVFVSFLAARWYGGEAGENEPVKRCRFAPCSCSDIEAAASTETAGEGRRGRGRLLGWGEGKRRFRLFGRVCSLA